MIWGYHKSKWHVFFKISMRFVRGINEHHTLMIKTIHGRQNTNIVSFQHCMYSSETYCNDAYDHLNAKNNKETGTINTQHDLTH